MPGTSTEPVVDKGIRQKSIHSFHSVHSFPDGSAFCPGAPKRVPSDSEKHRRVYMSSNVCHSHEWRVDTASGLTLKKQNACLHAVRHAVGKKIACIHGLRSEGVKIKVHPNRNSVVDLKVSLLIEKNGFSQDQSTSLWECRGRAVKLTGLKFWC